MKKNTCPHCGSPLSSHSESKHTHASRTSWTSAPSTSQISIIQGHKPIDQPVQFSIGPYQILQSIGKGGMGEVFLAYDTTCGRRIALKRIRTDLTNHQQIYNRFVKEAHITSQLTHPSIIPIYAIHSENQSIYYTMPFVEGETLRQILKKTRLQEKRGEKINQASGSIPGLIRVLINICQATAYAHSKGVLHRDLKPENIIIGKYGEVLILDWGLAKMIASQDDHELIEDPESQTTENDQTHTGKIVGTISYMAPERALGHPATLQTDIYALGVILYQILSLHLPFSRKSLKDFQQSMHQEKFIDPAEVAPYRDVPKILSEIAKKCLEPNPNQRYHSVLELIRELENYIEGRSEWFRVAELNIHNKEDWEFQENVLIAEHMAITRHTEESDWVSLMISKLSLTGNTKVEARVRLKEKGYGLGFLFSIPEAEERKHLNDGYCLWIGSDQSRATKLLRSTVEVMNAHDTFLQRHSWYHVRIEKVETNLHFYLNDVLQFSYISHSPVSGTHIGLLARDADFEISDFFVYTSSQNITVSCLSVPDAFLANKDYAKALSEYRRIGYSFLDRAEGREALFRAGFTILEQAQNETNPDRASNLYDQALQEFGKLHNTPGVPLEYLGKALVYETLHDYEEEIKCFELSYRRYPHHPLLPVLQEQILYRMHNSSHHHRIAAYNFILLVVRWLPEITSGNDVKKLFNNLQKHWEPLYFFNQEEDNFPLSPQLKNLHFAISLAFWLTKPYTLDEVIAGILKMKEPNSLCLGNALFALLELERHSLSLEWVKKIHSTLSADQLNRLQPMLDEINIALLCHSKSADIAFQTFFSSITYPASHSRLLIYLMDYALEHQQENLISSWSKQIKDLTYPPSTQLTIDSRLIWAYLQGREWNKAGQLLQTYPLEQLNRDTSPLHFLYGCWLYVSEGKEIASIHFSGILDVSFPRSWSLFAHYLSGKLEQRWFSKAFAWEKKQLYKQASLFYQCADDLAKAKHYAALAAQEMDT